MSASSTTWRSVVDAGRDAVEVAGGRALEHEPARAPARARAHGAGVQQRDADPAPREMIRGRGAGQAGADHRDLDALPPVERGASPGSACHGDVPQLLSVTPVFGRLTYAPRSR